MKLLTVFYYILLTVLLANSSISQIIPHFATSSADISHSYGLREWSNEFAWNYLEKLDSSNVSAIDIFLEPRYLKPTFIKRHISLNGNKISGAYLITRSDTIYDLYQYDVEGNLIFFNKPPVVESLEYEDGLLRKIVSGWSSPFSGAIKLQNTATDTIIYDNNHRIKKIITVSNPTKIILDTLKIVYDYYYLGENRYRIEENYYKGSKKNKRSFLFFLNSKGNLEEIRNEFEDEKWVAVYDPEGNLLLEQRWIKNGVDIAKIKFEYNEESLITKMSCWSQEYGPDLIFNWKFHYE